MCFYRLSTRKCTLCHQLHTCNVSFLGFHNRSWLNLNKIRFRLHQFPIVLSRCKKPGKEVLVPFLNKRRLSVRQSQFYTFITRSRLLGSCLWIIIKIIRFSKRVHGFRRQRGWSKDPSWWSAWKMSLVKEWCWLWNLWCCQKKRKCHHAIMQCWL